MPPSTKTVVDSGTSIATFNGYKSERYFTFSGNIPSGKSDPFIKEEIENQLNAIDTSNPAATINQDPLGLCGPATFFYCLLKNQPSYYKKVVIDLWNSGKAEIGSLKLEPNYKCRNPHNEKVFFGKNAMNAINWMTLAVLRSHQNKVMKALGSFGPLECLADVTTPSAIASWFNEAGSKTLHDGMYSIKTFMTENQLKESYKKYEEGCKNGCVNVIAYVRSKKLYSDDEGNMTYTKEKSLHTRFLPAFHYIVIDQIYIDSKEKIVNYTYSHWGKSFTMSGEPIKNFLKFCKGMMIFSTIPVKEIGTLPDLKDFE